MSRPDAPELGQQELPGLVRAQARSSKPPAKKKPFTPSAVDPVARVLVDLPLAHLDRPFDYLVPEAMAASAVPGARVKVRFAGQDVDAYIVARLAASDHEGKLSPLRRLVSPEPVLSPEIAELSALVAGRYAGSRADVLRLAVPPRHATTEKEPSPVAAPASIDPAPAEAAWSAHQHGPAFIAALAAGNSPRAVWSAAPGTDWAELLAHVAAATCSSGRGALLCVPDGKDVVRVDAALTRILGPGHHVALTADSGPSARYSDFLAVSRGARRIVVGTRAAAFAPVHKLGLVAIWDDGDDLHADLRAPYPHAREVLLMRAAQQETAALVGGFARTVESEYLLRTGWAREMAAPRALIRERLTTSIAGATDTDMQRDPYARSARIPKQVWDTIRSALEHGPVLVQTPRSGYAASLACERCRGPARCRACEGPLRLSGPTSPPACGWCGDVDNAWRCATCGHHGLRAPVLGDSRTAEELGRAFPSVLVRTSSGDRVLDSIADANAIVVATPGAEPVAERGYAAVVLLDTWLALARADLRTDEEALRRWMNAAALCAVGGKVAVVGDVGHPALQALVRWDPAGFAQREMSERQSAHLPPASRIASITGSPGALDDALTLLRLPPNAEVLGPVAFEADRGPESRAVVRVPRADGVALSEALGEMQRLRSARKLDAVRVQVDPASL